MSSQQPPASDSPLTGDDDWKRRRRLAAAFGEVLPETTDDERDPAERGETGNDAWLRAQVPPHHG